MTTASLSIKGNKRAPPDLFSIERFIQILCRCISSVGVAYLCVGGVWDVRSLY